MRINKTESMALASLFALGLLLGTSSHVQAEPTVLFGTDDTKAIGIQNLSYNNELWNVGFTDFVSARNVYGDFPGRYDFPGIDLAEGAILAVNDVLNTSVATGVGSETLSASDTYAIGYGPLGGSTFPESVRIATGLNNTNWGVGTLDGSALYNVAENSAPTWADFTLAALQTTVLFDVSGTNAIGIENLDLGGTLYDVAFTASVTADEVYGTFPGEYDFNADGAISAVDAVTELLNDAGAATVGEGESAESFFVGYFSSDPFGVESVTHREAEINGTWDQNTISDVKPYNSDPKVWADFTEASVVPVPAAAWLFGSGLLGLVGVARLKSA